MKSRFSAHLRHHAVAYLALFLALASTSVAAVTLRPNSVNSRHIVDRQVKSADIDRGAVNSSKVADRSLRRIDFGRNQLPVGPQGPAGPQGPQGPEGPRGLEGPPAGPRTRSASIPLSSFVDCDTTPGGLIDFSSGADTIPNFARNATQDGSGHSIAFDADVGDEDEFFDLCSQLAVPEDWASGGALQVSAAQNLGATTPTENIRCRFAVDGNAAQPASIAAVTAQPATSYTCSPTLPTLSTNSALTVNIAISTGTGPPDMNDPVFVYSVDFVYQAAG